MSPQGRTKKDLSLRRLATFLLSATILVQVECHPDLAIDQSGLKVLTIERSPGLSGLSLPVAFEGQPGSTIILHCFSTLMPSKWKSNAVTKWKNIENESKEHLHRVGPCDVSESEYKYCSSLVIERPQALDTGEYTCKMDPEGLYNQSGVPDSALEDVEKIYIFINDPESLRAGEDFFMVKPVHEYDPLTIACLPSHPEVNVTLAKVDSMVGDFVPLSHDLAEAFEYDPRIGFRVAVARAEDYGSYKCVYTRGEVSVWNQINVQIMPALKELTRPNKPILEMVQNGFHILLHSEREVKLGSDFRLYCNITKDLGQVIRVFWFKNGEIIVPPKTDRDSTNPRGMSYTYSYLSIKEAGLSDSGNYTCKVNNHVDQFNAASVRINLVDEIECDIGHVRTWPSPNAVLASADECVPVNVHAGEVAILVMDLAFTPDSPHQIVWQSPDEVVRTSDEHRQTRLGSAKFSFRHPSPANHTALLYIYNVSIWDHGQYSFFCPHDLQDQIHFCLNVADQPRASLQVKGHLHQDSLFTIGLDYEFHCDITANPEVLEVTWRICDSNASYCVEETQTEVQRILNSRKFHFEASKSLAINESTLSIQCQACSKMACGNSSQITIQPIDFFPPKKEIFGICLQTRAEDDHHCEVIEELEDEAHIERYQTERLHVSCSNWIGDEHEAPQLFSQSFQDIELDRSISKFSNQVSLVFPRLVNEHQSEISCLGKNLYLNINNISEPVPSNGSFNMDGEEIVTTLNKSQQASLQCTMTGIPKPTIQWFKDHVPLDVSTLARLGKIALLKEGTVVHFHALHPEDEGLYECQVENLGGTRRFQKLIRISSWHEGTMVQSLLSVIFLFLFVVLALGIVLVFLCQRNKLKEERITEAELAQFRFGDPKAINPSLPLEEQTDLLPYDEDIEFPKDRLKLGQQIGSGAFGRVVKAMAFGILDHEPVSTVAVKTVKPPVTKPHLIGLMAEIKIMLHIGKHLNVVNILGACTKDLAKRELFAIVEYCCHGSLQQFLLKHRKSFINQVNPITGIYDPNKVQKTPRNRKRNLGSKGSSDVNYTTLDIQNDNVGQDENDKISPLPMRQKKLSNVSRFSADESFGFPDTPLGRDRRHKVSIVSTDSEMECVVNSADQHVPSQHIHALQMESLVSRTHKTSIQSADSDYEHIENATDMTILSSRKRSHDEMNQPEEQRDTLATKDLLSWAYQIARGMEHLSNKRIIHGDLAARNVLLAENNVVKIGDFGLARNIYSNPNYKKTSGGPLPIKWMAVESLMSQIFSSQSDVWSYGIVLWELFSMARMPYPGIEPDENFSKLLESGFRMEKPTYAPQELYKVMKDCWLAEPELRPNFAELAEKIGDELHVGEREHYLILNKPFEEENQQRQTKYVYLQQTAHQHPKSDGVPSELSPMLPRSFPDQMEEDSNAKETPPTGVLSFFNPAYRNVKCDQHPRVLMGKKRQASSKSLHLFKVSASDSIKPFQSQIQLNQPKDQVGLELHNVGPANHSTSSLSSGFHSNSSDVLKNSLQKRHLEQIQILEGVFDDPMHLPSYESLTSGKDDV